MILPIFQIFIIIIFNLKRMGGGSSIIYSVPVTQKPQHESAVYRNPKTKDNLVDRPQPHLTTMKDIILNSAQIYSSRPALGTIVTKDNQKTIEYLTYQELLQQSQWLGSGIIRMKLFNQPQDQKMRFVGIFSKNRKEWAFTDFGCLLYGITSIPIYDTLGDQNITYVLRHTELLTVFVNDGALKSLIRCKDLVNLKNIVCFDPFNQEQIKYFKQKGVQLIPFENVINIGKEQAVDYNAQEYKVYPNDCLTFSYTSGTTGPPKGAMLAHKNLVSFIASEKYSDLQITSEDTTLSYLPLPHVLQRSVDYLMMYKGARIVYFSGDVQKLKDDLAIVRPTAFISVPRLFTRLYDAIKHKFNQLQGWTKTALEYALNTKIQNLKKTGACTHAIYDRIFFQKTRQALGGRCRVMVSGSAPLLPEVQHFLKVVFCVPLIEAYGQTEATGVSHFGCARDPAVQIVGGPVANAQFKLVDIPEMHYLSTDRDQQGRPAPRGEIWCRGHGVFLGYYHDKIKTQQTITADGWLKTGDVGMMFGQSKSLRIIDRKKNIFKLQQGEYVAAEKVENIYMECNLLAEVFLHGQSTQTFAIAIVVPHRHALMEFAASKGIEGDLETICKSKVIRAEVLASLNKIGKDAGLQGFQQAKNVYIDTQSFLTKGILTNTMKIVRHLAKKAYQNVISQVYKEGMLKVDKN